MTKGNDTKEKVYNAAMRLFSKNGYGETSVRHIAEEAGVNQASIYWAYKNKEEILEDIVSNFLQRMERYILTKEDADRLIEKESTREILEQVFTHFRQAETEYMYMAYKIVCTEQFNNQKASDLVFGEYRSKVKNGIQYLLELMKERGKIKKMNVDFISELWVQSLFSDFVLWIHTIDKYGMEGLKSFTPTNKKMIDLILTGNI